MGQLGVACAWKELPAWVRVLGTCPAVEVVSSPAPTIAEMCVQVLLFCWGPGSRAAVDLEVSCGSGKRGSEPVQMLEGATPRPLVQVVD